MSSYFWNYGSVPSKTRRLLYMVFLKEHYMQLRRQRNVKDPAYETILADSLKEPRTFTSILQLKKRLPCKEPSLEACTDPIYRG